MNCPGIYNWALLAFNGFAAGGLRGGGYVEEARQQSVGRRHPEAVPRGKPRGGINGIAGEAGKQGN